MPQLRRLPSIALPYVIWLTIATATPAVIVHGQNALAELTLPSPPIVARSSIIDPLSARHEVRPPLLSNRPPEFASRSVSAPAAGSRTGTNFASSFRVAGPGLAIQLAGETPTVVKTFTSDFPLTENPISENGVWRHLGMAWAHVRSVANHAVGTQTGSGGYDDSYAYLTGFGPDQSARARLSIDLTIGGNYREVELLLRWADSPTSARGYECNLSWNGSYAEIVRWNGSYGDFTYITKQTSFAPGIMPPGNGDIFKATISGSTIHVYLNKNDGKGDQLIVSGTDGTFVDGGPGMGFFIQGHVDQTLFGFSSYAASSD